MLSTAVIILLLSIALSALPLTSFGNPGLDREQVGGKQVGRAMALSRRYLPSTLSKLNSKRVPLLFIFASFLVAFTLVAMLVFGEVIEGLVILSNSVFVTLYIVGSLAGLVLLDKKLCPAISLISLYSDTAFCWRKHFVSDCSSAVLSRIAIKNK